MSENDLKTYKGNCHCGAFQFEVASPQIKTVTFCNCSLCSKKGYLWIFPPLKNFKVIKGDGALVGYQFGNESMTHKFCPTCGTAILIERNSEEWKDNISLNVRALLDVNPFSLEIDCFDGRGKFQPNYVPPTFIGKLPEAEIEGSKIYNGSCHCGSITLAIKTKPLLEIPVKEDNCSICQRNANRLIYPHRSQVTVDGTKNITEYLFGRKFTGHCFCKICGVQVYLKIHGPPKEVFEKLSAARQEALRPNFELFPVRIAVLDDVEWNELEIEKNDVGTEGYSV